MISYNMRVRDDEVYTTGFSEAYLGQRIVDAAVIRPPARNRMCVYVHVY